ncbi:MAG: amidohydrolase family protein [Acidobacteriota bacterium]
MAELAGCGLTLLEAIQAATSRAADLLGVQDRTGSIQKGLEADLIAVERNPLEDLVALQDVLLVISDGKIALETASKCRFLLQRRISPHFSQPVLVESRKRRTDRRWIISIHSGRTRIRLGPECYSGCSTSNY